MKIENVVIFNYICNIYIVFANSLQCKIFTLETSNTSIYLRKYFGVWQLPSTCFEGVNSKCYINFFNFYQISIHIFLYKLNFKIIINMSCVNAKGLKILVFLILLLSRTTITIAKCCSILPAEVNIACFTLGLGLLIFKFIAVLRCISSILFSISGFLFSDNFPSGF